MNQGAANHGGGRGTSGGSESGPPNNRLRWTVIGILIAVVLVIFFWMKP